MASLDLTPSPVPRVSLVHANGTVDISLVPGPNVVGSRNLPTVAARHVLGPSRARAATPAMTLPPQRESLGEGRLARKLKTDVRSSKREIVFGLGIGLGLSVVLAGVGRTYLDTEHTLQAQVDLETTTLSALPRSEATVATTEPEVTSAPEPSSDEAQRGGAAADVAEPLPALEQVVAAAPAVAKPAAAARKPRAHRAAPRRPPPQRPPALKDTSPAGLPPPAKAPLSPSESAGLGLDLPL